MNLEESRSFHFTQPMLNLPEFLQHLAEIDESIAITAKHIRLLQPWTENHQYPGSERTIGLDCLNLSKESYKLFHIRRLQILYKIESASKLIPTDAVCAIPHCAKPL